MELILINFLLGSSNQYKFPVENICLYLISLLIFISLVFKLFATIIPIIESIKSAYFSNLIKDREYLFLYFKNQEKPKFVLITGCTEGIGKGYCAEFYKMGFSLILVSRNPLKLELLKSQLKLRGDSSQQIHCVPFDFSENCLLTDYENKLFGYIQHNLKVSFEQIAMVVNNVGIYNGAYFKNATAKEAYDYINVNILPTLFITKLYLDMYFRLNCQHRMCLINLSSVSGEIPDPCNAIYSATKKFIDTFSIGLQKELRLNQINNVHIFSIKPSYVSTSMVPLEPSRIRILSTEQHCTATIQRISEIIRSGTGKVSINGHFNHELESLVFNNVPTHILRRLFKYDSDNF